MDEYTPHGYLDNPWHFARHNPSGVLRCQPAIGFAWHFPGLAGHYTQRELYSAGLRVAVYAANGLPLLTAADFAAAGITVVSHLHSQDIMSFDWRQGDLTGQAAYFLNHEHALCCLISIDNGGDQHKETHWALVAEYGRSVATGEQCDCGLLTRWRPKQTALTLLAYPEGVSFACLTEQEPSSHNVATSIGELLDGLERNDSGQDLAATVPGQGWTTIYAAMNYRLVVGPGARIERLVVLGRGSTEQLAMLAAHKAMRDGRQRYDTVRAADSEWRRGLPKLAEAWPAHWRRGLVYDAATLRAVVRPPRGIYHHPWDGMQVHSPRAVLAEAALDALLLSYADPQRARQVMLGVFADSPEANVPCTREDGSYNMVAQDGEACGTAPAWGFPLYCIDLLYRRTGDRPWLATIYPYLARYLNWWIRKRSDESGWLHYHCSWESGQDESPRFGRQSSGGTLIQHVIPADLHASVAQGAAILAHFAGELNREHQQRRWLRLAERYTDHTQALWHDNWFHDYDARERTPIGFRDAMHLSPVLAGIATPEQLAVLRPSFVAPPAHGIWPALEWPPVVFTIVEAAAAAGWHELAGGIAAGCAEHAYQAYDAREWEIGRPLPGVASEHWAPNGSWGCEGYGWGAMGTLLVLRHVLGWQEAVDGNIELHPALPAAWLAAGRRFRAGPLYHRGTTWEVSYRCQGGDQLEISVTWTGKHEGVRISDGSGQAVREVAASGNGRAWQGCNGGSYRIEMEIS